MNVWGRFGWSRNKKESDQPKGAQPNMGVQRGIGRISPAAENASIADVAVPGKLSLAKLIPSLDQLDNSARGDKFDVKKQIRNSTVPDHLIASMILSNIFLLPRSMKDESDSWPVYEDEIHQLGKVRVECIEREYKERIAQRRGKDKKSKKKMFFKLLDVKRDATNRYFEDYEKILGSYIQRIRVEIIPVEREISTAKYRLGDLNQRLTLINDQYLDRMKDYNNLRAMDREKIGRFKDIFGDALTLKKLGHVLVSYGVAAFSSVELVLSDGFKHFVTENLSRFASMQGFLNTQFPVLQGLIGAAVFSASIGLYNRFVIDLFKRRDLKKRMAELDSTRETTRAEIEEINDKIIAFKQERDSKVKALTEKAQKSIEFLYRRYKLAMARPKIENAIDNTLDNYMKEVAFLKDGNPNVLDLLAENVLKATGADAELEEIKDLIIRRINELDL